MLNKTCILVTATCLTVISLPSHAWQAARGAYGGAAARGNYGGAAVRTPSGAAAVRTPSGNKAYRPPSGYGGAYHAPVPAYGYRPPVNVNYGYSSGQVAAAGVAGLAVGAMAGSAAAKSSAPPPPTTVVVQQPAPAAIPIGTNLNDLPGGCNSVKINSVQFFQCGSSWLRAYSGYYQVVPAPY